MKTLSNIHTEAPKAASSATREANAAVLKELDFAHQEDFQDAQRGLIAPLPEGRVNSSHGDFAWDLNTYSFLGVSAPSPIVSMTTDQERQSD